MAADSVGQIGLDLVVNQNGFQKQMSGIQSLAKKAGAALAGAFAVKKLVAFGAQCIELGSDLAEVQNVVDVTFPKMSKQIDAFAQNAAAQFGLSETMAKQFTGTFGAMAKAFGFGEQAAYEMSTTLTGLAGDVASFYNISQDEAYTKLKSVFTGETESLKDLGIVMTQTALDSYALANGFGKTTAKMSEAEKVALRYQFVQEQLSLAAGDFERTSDGWANQVRILKLQFDSLKATIGQGLINVLTPVIKVINTIIGKLMSLANAFKAFTELITGKKGSGGTSEAAAGMDAVAGSAADAGMAVSGAGSAAKQAAKDLKTVTTGIDELNIIDPDTDSGDSESGSGYDVDSFDMGDLDISSVEELDSKYQGLLDRVKELGGLFQGGFQIGFQNQEGLDSIQSSLVGIKESAIALFTDPAVQNAGNGLLDAFALNLGKISGSIGSVGVTIGANLLGGCDSYLSENADYIKGRLVNIFSVGAEIANAWGDIAIDFADVFKVFEGETGRQVTANIIGIFSNAALGAREVVGRNFANVSQLIADVFSANKDKLKTALEETLKPLETVTGSIAGLVTNTFEKVSKTYDEYIEPAFERFTAGWQEIVSGALDAYNEYLAPTLDWIAERFSALASNYIQPLLDAFVQLWGTATEALSVFWEFISPFVSWLLEVVFVRVSAWLLNLWTDIEGVISYASAFLTGIMEIATALIEFFVNVFTGQWEEAWQNIQTIVSTIFNAIRNVISTILTAVANKVLVILNGIRTTFSQAWNLIRNLTSTIWGAISSLLSTIWTTIKTTVSDRVAQLKDAVVNAWNTLKDTTKNIWDGIWSSMKGVINSIISGVENMVNRVVDGVNTIINGINSLAGPLAELVGIPLLPTFSRVSLPRLAQGGFVRANTPQLALIGDNRHQGEVVAPEDKMQAMADRAAALAAQAGSFGMSEQYLSAMVELLERIIRLIEQMDLTVNIDIREIKKRLTELDKRSGYTLRTT